MYCVHVNFVYHNKRWFVQRHLLNMRASSNFVTSMVFQFPRITYLESNHNLILLLDFIFYADKIPFYVNMTQKNDRNASDYIFIKDIPITFDVQIHDPSHYLNRSAISYRWNFGDGSGLFVSNSSVQMHTYTLLGNFSLDLSVHALIPAPCGPPTPLPPTPLPPGKRPWLQAKLK